MEGTMVSAMHILTTREIVVEAWKPTEGYDGYSTYTSRAGQLYGLMTTERWESDLPSYSQERLDAYAGFRRAKATAAYLHITRVHDMLSLNDRDTRVKWHEDRGSFWICCKSVNAAKALAILLNERAREKGAYPIETAS